jgi:hypothetical protein
VGLGFASEASFEGQQNGVHCLNPVLDIEKQTKAGMVIPVVDLNS